MLRVEAVAFGGGDALRCLVARVACAGPSIGEFCSAAAAAAAAEARDRRAVAGAGGSELFDGPSNTLSTAVAFLFDPVEETSVEGDGTVEELLADELGAACWVGLGDGIAELSELVWRWEVLPLPGFSVCIGDILTFAPGVFGCDILGVA